MDSLIAIVHETEGEKSKKQHTTTTHTRSRTYRQAEIHSNNIFDPLPELITLTTFLASSREQSRGAFRAGTRPREAFRKAEGRRGKGGGRRQKVEGRRGEGGMWKAEGRRGKGEGRRQKVEGRKGEGGR